MPETLIVHPGFHKTGTTALQSSLRTNRKALAAEGILYPPTKGATGHHHAVWALRETSHGWGKHSGQKTPEKVWRSLARRIRAHSGTAVLSSEFLIKSNDETIQRLAQDTDARRVHVVFTLRPLVDILPSAYQQYLKFGRATSYRRWLKDIFDAKRGTARARSFWMRQDHPAIVERWANIFGAENIHLIITDKQHPQRIFETFSSLLGLPETFLQPVTRTGLNRSLTWPEIELLREINKSFKRRRGYREYVTFVRGGALRKLTSKRPPTPDHSPLQTPRWAVEKAHKLSAAAIESFKQMDIQVHGDLGSLAGANLPIGRNKVTGLVSTKVAASMLLATKSERVLSRARTKKLLAELAHRLRRRVLPRWLRVGRYALWR
jgi:hypothetical protein